MTATVAGIHLGIDTHANRPAANACPVGSVYSCSTHGLIYKTDGSSWSTWATLGAAASGSITSSGYTQSTARLLGRTTASSGAIEEITVGSGLTLSAGSLSASGSASDVVQVTSGAGSVTIPGMSGDPDRKPASPDGDDKEFDSSTIGGTALGSPTTIDANTSIPSHLYIKRNAVSGENLTGRYWAYTPAAGDIIAAKLSDHTVRADFASVGLGVGEGTPGKVEAAILLHIASSGTWRADVTQWSTPTGSTTGVANTGEFRDTAPLWFAIRYNSSSSLDYFYSIGGHVFRAITTARNPGFTVGSFCLFINPVNGSLDLEAAFDYVRVRSTLIV